MLQVIFEPSHDLFLCRCSYQNRGIPKSLGFTWDPDLDKWVTQNPRVAWRLFEAMTADAQNKCLDLLGLNYFPPLKKAFEHPAHLRPYEYQLQAVKQIFEKPATYLAYEAGTGKTIIAALASNLVKRTLVVCPAFLKINWEFELKKWDTCENKIFFIFNKRSDTLDIRADTIIVPDSLISEKNVVDQLIENGPYDLTFVDEAHRFKNMQAKRTQMLLGLNKKHPRGLQHVSKRFVAMSGTPMPNRPIEVYALTAKVAPHAVNYFNAHMFGVRYCAGFLSEWGWDYTGASNTEELQVVLTRRFMHVKRLVDCVELPEKLPSQFLFMDDSIAGARKTEFQLLQKIRLANLIENEAMANENFAERVREKIEQDPSLGGLGFLSELRKNLGLRKVGAASKIIRDMLEANDKLVVFTWHKEVARRLQVELEPHDFKVITGDTNMKERDEIVTAFQTNDTTRGIIANIQAAGVGLTLTRASTILFVEPSWVPADNDQAIARCHRIGQTRQVQAFFLVMPHSLDHLILNAHIDKNSVIQTAIKPRNGE